MGDYTEAMEIYNSILIQAKKFDNKNEISNILSYIGIVNEYIGKFYLLL